ncbi:hypothetical protein [Brumimicrobium mesophilum]|uniref:hypothetical protein n=1 Tax=Brumimicrobium mesophilum TaxID=392717 RepID=UPI000D1412F6|nr:hypothetical protein [Brumimicrobium mesophilum]
MNKKLKVTIAILILLFGVVTLILFLRSQPTKEKFHLINQVSEADIAYHADLDEVLDDIIQYNSEVKRSLTNKVALNKLKNQLNNSGLDNKHIFITHSFKDKGTTSIYAEILDSTAFNSTFNQLRTLLSLKSLKYSIGYFISENKRTSIEKHEQYVKFNFGKGAENALTVQETKPSVFFTQQLEKVNDGIINTTGTPKLDSTDYATFTYSYGNEFNLTIDWNVSENPPLQLKNNQSVQLYPTSLKMIRAITNVDIEHAKKHLNQNLKDLILIQFKKLPVSAQELLKIWTGQSSIQMGGKIAQETVQITTEFDDDFNQVEKRIVKVDSILNIGLYWATSQPSQTLELLNKLPNVNFEKDKLQIALLPSLNTITEEKSVKSTSQNVDFEGNKENKLLYLNIDIKGLKGNLSIENISKETIQLQLKLEDWKGLSNPKELDISSFW